MPLVSAQLYVQSLLANMTPPGATGIRGPVQALITPLTPDVNPDGVARCYVWPGAGNESRRAMPRNTGMGTPAGWKNLPHNLELFLVWIDPDPDDAQVDVNFPLFIDWVMDIIRTSPNPAEWLDPDSGIVSNFANLGEKMRYDFIPPRTLEPDTIKRYDARVSITLLELFQRLCRVAGPCLKRISLPLSATPGRPRLTPAS